MGAFECHSNCLSSVCVLVCGRHWIRQFCHLLSCGTAEESTQQRFDQMGTATHRQCDDFLFEQLSGGIGVHHDCRCLLAIFSRFAHWILSTILVSFESRKRWMSMKLYMIIFLFRIRKFPPKPKLLTSEEFYEQGVLETTRALEELKTYCSSPVSKPWRMMTKLKDPQRFDSWLIRRGIERTD